MTPTKNPLATKLIETLIEHIEIPRSYYEKAIARHKSLGEWLCRPASGLAAYNPHVSPQGSFRYGTVTRPLVQTQEYDLDNVTMLEIEKTAMTQRQIKELYGAEIVAYAKANGMLAPVEEKDRCWRLGYADEVNFHVDALPCIPEAEAVILSLMSMGVPAELARRAIAIADRRHPHYDQITSALLSSNPRGFAKWFELRARQAADLRLRQLVEKKLYASVDDVPPYEWKTPLQGAIQIFKRHRDVMFHKNSAAAPISMIITNLAAHAYRGETDLETALTNLVQGMPQYVKPSRPQVPNPANPAEDYADKWARNPALEASFWLWHTQLKIDIGNLTTLFSGKDLATEVRNIFAVELAQDEIRAFAQENQRTRVVLPATPALYVPSAPRPWGDGV